MRNAFGAHFVEVEVDTELGRVARHQVPRRPRLRPHHEPAHRARARSRAARSWASAWRCTRTCSTTARNGQPLTAGYYGDRVPTHRDAPEIEVDVHRDRRRLRAVRREEHGRVGQDPVAGRVANADLQRDRPPHEGSADHARQDSGSAAHEDLCQRQPPRRRSRRVTLSPQDAQQGRQRSSFAGGGSDLLGTGEGAASSRPTSSSA